MLHDVMMNTSLGIAAIMPRASLAFNKVRLNGCHVGWVSQFRAGTVAVVDQPARNHIGLNNNMDHSTVSL